MRDPEEIRSLLSGPVNPLPTKFHKDGSINFAGMHGCRLFADAAARSHAHWGDDACVLLTTQNWPRSTVLIAHAAIRPSRLRAHKVGLHQPWNSPTWSGSGVRSLHDSPSRWPEPPESAADLPRRADQPACAGGDVPIEPANGSRNEPGVPRSRRTPARLPTGAMRWGGRTAGPGGRRRP